ncbi:plastocyanin/azurin family copper-binding protein [Pelagibius sp. Alg239-R121]|uniref:plastocyanin/azurin family copper-binding protein n=1 Tax=Pelagibius sp. Alg239-R121 TaxID=2993448 RepID=UPI0024A779EA|nr:plastocyanin/azurin family copper-binding protein [Pelagibius sp. Alg239-R121]
MKPKISKFSLCLLLFGGGCAWEQKEPREHVVSIVSDLNSMSMSFEPRSLHIEPGDTVTWINAADVTHNMITYPDGFPKGADGFESDYLLVAGERWSYRFQDEGTYEYHCLPHILMKMEGTVVVGKASGESDFHDPSNGEIARYREQLAEYFDEDEGVSYRPRLERLTQSE